MSNKYFDIQRDKQFPCFCQGCVVGKTEEQMSKRDARYCAEYQPFIEEEYALLSAEGHKKWYIPVPHVEIHEGKEKTKKSILNSPSPTMNNFRPRGKPTAYKNRCC